MIYEPEIQLNCFRQFLAAAERIPWNALSLAGQKTCHDEILKSLAMLSFRSKHQEYAPENEWRLFIQCVDKYRKVPARPVCTRELSICTPQTICEVILGPNNEESVAEVALFLRNNGYPNAEVRKIDSTAVS